MQICMFVVLCISMIFLASGCGDDDPMTPNNSLQRYSGPCSVITDNLNAGTRSEVSYTYNKAGRISVIDSDFNYDGEVDHRSTHTYDDQNRVTRIDGDYGTDGIIDARVTYVYSDASTVREFDTDMDGIANHRLVRHFDAMGRLVTEEEDEDGDGDLELRTTYHYGEDSRLLEKKADWGANGTVNGISTLEYDEVGRRIQEEFALSDGTLEWRITWNYDSDGNLSGILAEDFPSDSLGVTTRTAQTNTYDNAGNVLTSEVDELDDGAVDYRSTFSYDCFEGISPPSVFVRGSPPPISSQTQRGTAFETFSVDWGGVLLTITPSGMVVPTGTSSE